MFRLRDFFRGVLPRLQRPRLYSQQKLFTPGPLTTSKTTKEAMLRDIGSRDTEFISTVQFVRKTLVELAGVSPNHFTCVPVQGSGTYALESVLTTAVPKRLPNVLTLVNGAYGERAANICRVLGFDVTVIRGAEDEKLDVGAVEQALQAKSYGMVTAVHCETTSGVVNPVGEIGRLVKERLPDCYYLVDAMSSFGAVPFDLEAGHIDFMVSSCNKCLEGVPGFSFVVANTEKLLSCKGQSRSLSLDLCSQYEGLENSGQFRFTPPTHAFLAMRQALTELEAEGGIEARARRYSNNRETLKKGMRKMGFKEFLDDSHDGYIITSFRYPKHPNFSFDAFYNELNKLGMVIYPGKVTKADCFRIGNIGQLFEEDMQSLLKAVVTVCEKLKITLPLQE